MAPGRVPAGGGGARGGGMGPRGAAASGAAEARGAAAFEAAGARVAIGLGPGLEHFGAVVEGFGGLAGLGSGRPLQAEEAAAVRELPALLYARGMLVFKGQGGLDPADEVALCKLFPHDPDERHATDSYTGGAATQYKLPEHPEVAVVGTYELQDYYGFTGRSEGVYVGWAPSERAWHNDGFADTDPPPDITAMRCIETPPTGGETLFACSVRAAELLPPDLDPEPETVRVAYRLHEQSERRPSGIAMAACNGRRSEDTNASQDLVRPLVACEPVSGKRTLVGTYHVQAVHVPEVDGGFRELSCDASNDYVEKAWTPGLQEELIYTHIWEPEDLIIWSNRLVTHTATPVVHYAGQRRLLHRVRLRPPPEDSVRPWRSGPSLTG